MNDVLPIFSDRWQVAKLRRKLRGLDGIRIGPFGSALTLDQMVADGYKVYGQENVISNNFTAGSRYITPTKYVELKSCSIATGDLLVTMMGTTGRCCVVPESIQAGIMDSHLIRLRFQKEVDPDFMALLIDKGHYIREQIGAAGKGTIMSGLNSAIIKDVMVGFPDLKTQRALVRYVAEQTARIDRLMDMRRRQMALLKEQRATVIQQAVTRGLNPNAPMKDSGLPWLGEVPVHWILLPLKRWVRTPITDGPHETPELLAEGIDFVSAEAVQNGRINFDSRRGFIAESLHQEYCRKCKPQRDDIFMVKSGATTGKLAIVDTDIEFSVWSPLALVRVDKLRMLPRFMFEAMHAEYVLSQIQTTWSYGTQPNISMAAMGRLQVVAPPLNEQREILTFIERETSKFDSLYAAYARQLTLVTEYRTALIHECVTGQRTVPAAANA